MATTTNTPAEDFSALLPQNIDDVIQQWLVDDMPSFDVGGLVVGLETRKAQLWMKSSGVFAGKPFFQKVFDLLNCKVEWVDNSNNSNNKNNNNNKSGGDGNDDVSAASTSAAEEGTFHDIPTGDDKICLAVVTGPVRDILRGERTALNTISRCSGVATASRRAVDLAKSLGWNGYVAGTRKTTPGFRIVEKYGLLVGGAATHRLDLSQMVMLKDNHIWSHDGSITKAVKVARQAAGFSSKIEVECRNLDEAIEAASAGADIVMLDNYEPAELKNDARTIKQQYPHVLIEASGGITTQTMSEYVCDDIDIISQGKLTQGYDCIDFSLKIIQ